MGNMLRCLLLALACGPSARSGEPAAPVDLELLLLADSTSSIDDVEFALQRRGYAAALVDPDVVAAVRGGARRRIALAYVEWAGARRQVVVLDWMVIDGPAAAAVAAGRLLAAPRIVQGVNAIGAAIVHGVSLIETNGFAGDREVIDLSGDSAWNPRRPTLAEARAAAESAGVSINALAILCDDCSGRQGAGNLEQRLMDDVIAGPGAFVVTADTRADFADAIRRKLILEIAGSTPPPTECPRPARRAVDILEAWPLVEVVRVGRPDLLRPSVVRDR
jgi:hypothetical protein